MWPAKFEIQIPGVFNQCFQEVFRYGTVKVTEFHKLKLAKSQFSFETSALEIITSFSINKKENIGIIPGIF